MDKFIAEISDWINREFQKVPIEIVRQELTDIFMKHKQFYSIGGATRNRFETNENQQAGQIIQLKDNNLAVKIEMENTHLYTLTGEKLNGWILPGPKEYLLLTSQNPVNNMEIACGCASVKPKYGQYFISSKLPWHNFVSTAAVKLRDGKVIDRLDNTIYGEKLEFYTLPNPLLTLQGNRERDIDVAFALACKHKHENNSEKYNEMIDFINQNVI